MLLLFFVEDVLSIVYAMEYGIQFIPYNSFFNIVITISKCGNDPNF